MELNKVVVGIDFSALATEAARWVARTFAPDAELILVHVVDVPEPPAFLSGRVPPRGELIETATRGAETRLREIGVLVGGARMRPVVREGKPVEVLADVAAETGADLIVIGHGQRRGLWTVLGSTAEDLLTLSPVPVLLVREPPDDVPRTVLAAVDQSRYTPAVLATAALTGRRLGADVALLHVLNPGMVGRVGLISATRATERFEDDMIESGRRWLTDQAAAGGLDFDHTRLFVAFGAAGAEILAAAERLDNPIIVMGSRGAGTLGRMILGSVARTVARGTRCPLIIVSGKD